MTPIRAAFETWASGMGADLSFDGVMYTDRDVHHWWQGFRAGYLACERAIDSAPDDAREGA